MKTCNYIFQKSQKMKIMSGLHIFEKVILHNSYSLPNIK